VDLGSISNGEQYLLQDEFNLMADTGYLDSGNQNYITIGSPSAIFWTTTANIAHQDSNNSTLVNMFGIGVYSYALEAYNFNTNVIPAGSTINGIALEINRYASTPNTHKDYMVTLVNGGTTIGASNYADTTNTYPNSMTMKTYGGPTDQWGISLTAAIVKSSTFGAVLSVQCTVGCFIKGTRIMTPKGEVSIERLKVGDFVVSFDEERKMKFSKVTGLMKQKVDKLICLNGRVTASEEHPFRTNNGFKKLGKLKEGDLIWTIIGWTKVHSLLTFYKTVSVYNLSVSGDETYFANGYGVHNKGTTVFVDYIGMRIYYTPAPTYQFRIQGNKLRFHSI